MTNYTPDIDIVTATQQQMFDFMVNHLRSQGKPSVNTLDQSCEPLCMYRGSNGLMCAIGCMIPDSLYDSDLEGESVSMYLRVVGVSREAGTRSFLSMAQPYLHDDLSGELPEDFLTLLEENAINLAEVYKLEYIPPVTQETNQ